MIRIKASSYDFAYVVSGLMNADNSIISITYVNSTRLSINNFKSDTSGVTLIKVLARLRNPDVSGTSLPFYVTIYEGS